jgi:hypothetical protein
VFAIVASCTAFGSANADSCNSKPVNDAVAVVEMVLMKFLREKVILIGILNWSRLTILQRAQRFSTGPTRMEREKGYRTINLDPLSMLTFG